MQNKICQNIPIEVIQDILQYVIPRRLHKLSSQSHHARYIVNGMDRCKYIDKWLCNTIICKHCNTFWLMTICSICKNYIYIRSIGDYDIQYMLENNWFYKLQFTNNTYKYLLEKLEGIKNKKLYLVLETTICDTELYALTNVYALDLRSTDYLTNDGINSGALRHTAILKMEYIINITNIKLDSLRNIKVLSLININITDECLYNIALTNIKYLNITGCDKITNVGIGYLGNIYKLTMSLIPHKWNVNALCNAHTLYIKGHIVENSVQALTNVYDLRLCQDKFSKIEDTHISKLSNVYRLHLSFIDNITEKCTTTLGNVHQLNICHCNKLKNINSVDILAYTTVKNSYTFSFYQ